MKAIKIIVFKTIILMCIANPCFAECEANTNDYDQAEAFIKDTINNIYIGSELDDVDIIDQYHNIDFDRFYKNLESKINLLSKTKNETYYTYKLIQLYIPIITGRFPSGDRDEYLNSFSVNANSIIKACSEKWLEQHAQYLVKYKHYIDTFGSGGETSNNVLKEIDFFEELVPLVEREYEYDEYFDILRLAIAGIDTAKGDYDRNSLRREVYFMLTHLYYDSDQFDLAEKYNNKFANVAYDAESKKDLNSMKQSIQEKKNDKSKGQK